MQHVFITADGQRIALKIHRKSQGSVEFVEDTGLAQIASSQWSEDVMNEIAATSADPRRALEAVLSDYEQRYPAGFERMPLSRSDLESLLGYFANLQEDARLTDDDSYWGCSKAYDEQSALQDLETTLETR